MRFEKGHKAATRQRIVETASAKFRKDGIASVGIAGLMADAGLTHGGFYAHFESKEALVRVAIETALEATRARMDRAAATNEAGLEGLIRTYLRPSHRDTPERGCAIAALAAEIARHDPPTRAAFGAGVETFLARLQSHLPAALCDADKRRRAIGILAVMLGALQLSRVVVDADASDEILQSGIEAALRLAAGGA
jgi:TetR/AcrR family transcriptional repressor of nem operon